MIYTYGLNYLNFKEISLEEIISLLNIQKIALDSETSGLNPWFDKLLLLALGNSDFQIIMNCRDCEGGEAVINSIKDKKIIIHNSKNKI